MLTYRGDIFVKGKKFKINESLYRFQKRDSKDRLVFESIDTKELIRLTDSEFKKSNKPIIKEAGDRIRGELGVKSISAWRDYKKNNPNDRR